LPKNQQLTRRPIHTTKRIRREMIKRMILLKPIPKGKLSQLLNKKLKLMKK